MNEWKKQKLFFSGLYSSLEPPPFGRSLKTGIGIVCVGGEVCLGFVVGFKDGIPASLVFFYFAWEGLGGADG